MRKLKHYTLLVILTLSSSISWSQNFESLSNFGGNGYEEVNALDILSNTNVIMAGQFENTVDFDESATVLNKTAVGNKDLFLKCVDTNNNLVWVSTFGGSLNEIIWSVASDQQNNIYISGNFSGTVDFDPSNSVVNLTSNGGEDIFVCKYNNGGNLIWARSFGGTQNDNGRELIVNPNGEVVLGGWFRNTVNFIQGNTSFTRVSSGGEEAFICKLNPSGIPIWVNTYGSNTNNLERVYSMKFDQNGDILLTGVFGGTVDFDKGSNTTNLISNGSEDAFLAKIDANGNHIWAKSWGGSSEELSLSLQIDSNSDIIVGGSFQGTTDLDPSATNFNVSSPGGRDAFIVKFTNLGNFIWGKTIGSNSFEVCYAIEIDNADNIYAMGYYFVATDFDPGAGVALTPSGGNVNGDGYFLKLESSGNFKWVYPINTPGSDNARCAQIDNNFNIYIGGGYTGTFDFDPGSSTALGTSFGGSDAFVVKLNDCQQSDSSIFEVACAAYTSPSGRYTWTTSGNYTDTLQNRNGCDSVITINLFVTNQNKTVTQNGFTLTSNATNSTFQWLDCSNGNTAISGETNASFTATQNGDYAVELTQNGCKDTSACVTVLGVGLESSQFTNQTMILAPNPTNGNFNIQFQSNFTGVIEIYNSVGQSVYNSMVNDSQVDLSLNVSKGIYLVRLTNEAGEISTSKLLVE